MSGIVAVACHPGQMPDAGLLRFMTAALRSYGPDGQSTWREDGIGLGHAAFATTEEASGPSQPFSLDGQVWITADVRLDRRLQLVEALAARSEPVTPHLSDAELLLHAYAVWGEGCVGRLQGDFAFIIWDRRQRRLFCARDHFGVKPFYYAVTADGLVASNSLKCLRSHPGLSDTWNDRTVGDFLLFGYNQDPHTTFFAAIQRLPPAHTLTWEVGAPPALQRYWSLPVEEPIRYRRPSEYVEHFRALFRTAVEDRLRTERVAVFMSGGMDSTSVAAMAHQILSGRGNHGLRAYTFSSEGRIAGDEEANYAAKVAVSLGIPLTRISTDGYRLFERWNCEELALPEPLAEPLFALVLDQYRLAARHGRVALTGQGGDPSLYPGRFYLWNLAKRFRWATLVADVGAYVREQRRLPPLHVRTILLGNQSRAHFGRRAVYPPWLAPEFAARYDLPTRWEAWLQQLNVGASQLHPTRPEAYENLTSVLWPFLFEAYYAAGAMDVPLEIRHPFFDVELVAFLLRVPPVPWCVDKYLLRQAMCGILDNEVRLRSKATFDVPLPSLLLSEYGLPDRLQPEPMLERLVPYVDLASLRTLMRLAQRLGAAEHVLVTRPLSLAIWAAQPAPKRYSTAMD